jgi:acyl-CoA thioester hydrolase
MTELWRAAFGSYDAMVEHGVDIVVAEAHLRFRSPARFDDLVTLEVAVEPLGTTNIPTRHRVLRGEEVLVEAAMRHVMVDARTYTKTPIPEWLRAGLAPYATGDGAPTDPKGP